MENKSQKKVYKQSMKLMGNRFEITVVESSEERASYYIDIAVQEIKRIERLLTTFDPDSETNLINDSAGLAPVKVSMEVVALIERSLKLSELTQGAFDITYGSINKDLWNFNTNMKSLPDKKTAAQMVKLINYRNVIVNTQKSTVFLKEKGMRIGFGGIGKGYAAESAKKILREQNVQSGIINASGDLAAWGVQPDGKQWTIGIADPNAISALFSSFNISDMAVATSGNYEKFVTINGKKYSHTIDPKTGLPVRGIKSTTIICTNAEIADALTTPVMVMGIKAGLYMINQIKGVGCIIVDDNNNLFTSSNIRLI